MSFSCKKEEFDRCFKRLDWPVEESQPDRFPSLLQVKSKTRLNARILKLNFLSDLANGAEVLLSSSCAADRDLKILSVV